MEAAISGKPSTMEITVVKEQDNRVVRFAAGAPARTPITPRTPGAGTPRKEERILDFLKANPSSKSGRRLSAQLLLKRVTSTRRTGGRNLRVPFVRSVNWRAQAIRFKNWATHLENAALLVWLFFVFVGVTALILLLANVVDDQKENKRWTEITNQFLNALFTIMCLYQHPRLFHHLALLVRWQQPDDAVELCSVYCRNGATDVRHVRFHIAFVLFLFHLTCIIQYLYCALFWTLSSSQRPDWAVDLLLALGLGTPTIAGLYMSYGPLGKKVDRDATEDDVARVNPATQPGQDLPAVASPEDGSYDNNNNSNKILVTNPTWAGGLFDVDDDWAVSGASFFCTFCVFGWNLERVGFGNMYVHVFTLLLLCMAPLIVFSVAAVNTDDAPIRFVVGSIGAVLSILGLLYGGFWRVRLRKQFQLPADRRFCGRAAIADYAKWLVCTPCALAQEVRTANFYDVEDGSFYLEENVEGSDDSGDAGVVVAAPQVMGPLERESSVRPMLGPGDQMGLQIAVAH